jgi:hypothetical protein
MFLKFGKTMIITHMGIWAVTYTPCPYWNK